MLSSSQAAQGGATLLLIGEAVGKRVLGVLAVHVLCQLDLHAGGGRDQAVSSSWGEGAGSERGLQQWLGEKPLTAASPPLSCCK